MFRLLGAVLACAAIAAAGLMLLRREFADFRHGVRVPKLRVVKQLNQRQHKAKHRAEDNVSYGGFSTAQALSIHAKRAQDQIRAEDREGFQSWFPDLLAAQAGELTEIGPGHDHYVALAYLPRVPNAPYDADVWSIWGTQMEDDEWAGRELVRA